MTCKQYDKKIMETLNEDNIYSDITTDYIFGDEDISYGELIAKEDCIIAGLPIFKRVFTLICDDINIETFINDGDKVKKGDTIAHVRGNTKCILKAGRTALNFVQRLSGIATKTKVFCDRVKDFNVRVTDTRKTTPGLRLMEKYAVRVGGGHNHRLSLADGVLIKDNHISSCGSIKHAIEKVREKISHTVKIEVEVKDLKEVKEALLSGVDIIMLDNMTIDKMKEAVNYINKKVLVEAQVM